MKRFIIFFVIALFVLPVLAHAQAEVDKGSYEDSWPATIHEDSYLGDVPRHYGLESIFWILDCKVHWVFVTNKNGINVTYQVQGKLSIYDEEGGTLLDVKPYHFKIKEHIFDKNEFHIYKEKIANLVYVYFTW